MTATSDETAQRGLPESCILPELSNSYCHPGGAGGTPSGISPSGTGYDIGCGNKAVLTDADAQDVRANIARIMDDVWSTVSFGIGRKNREDVDHELFENDDAWQITQGANSAAWKLTSLRDMARAQLGTVGSGNHYVDILQDEQERIWVGVILAPAVWATRSPRGF